MDARYVSIFADAYIRRQFQNNRHSAMSRVVINQFRSDKPSYRNVFFSIMKSADGQIQNEFHGNKRRARATLRRPDA